MLTDIDAMKYQKYGKILVNETSVYYEKINIFNSRSEEKSHRMETIEEKLGRATNYLHDIKVIGFNN